MWKAWLDHSEDSLYVKNKLIELNIPFVEILGTSSEEHPLPMLESEYLLLHGRKNIERYAFPYKDSKWSE